MNFTQRKDPPKPKRVRYPSPEVQFFRPDIKHLEMIVLHLEYQNNMLFFLSDSWTLYLSHVRYIGGPHGHPVTRIIMTEFRPNKGKQSCKISANFAPTCWKWTVLKSKFYKEDNLDYKDIFYLCSGLVQIR